jgi:hypothetical protein
MIDPSEIMHPLDISYEFLEEFKRHCGIYATVATVKGSSVIDGPTTRKSLEISLKYDSEIIGTLFSIDLSKITNPGDT